MVTIKKFYGEISTCKVKSDYWEIHPKIFHLFVSIIVPSDKFFMK